MRKQPGSNLRLKFWPSRVPAAFFVEHRFVMAGNQARREPQNLVRMASELALQARQVLAAAAAAQEGTEHQADWARGQ
eukprot:12431433-Karenia_brevis.AAC.1